MVKTADGMLEHKEVKSNAVFDYVYGDTDPWSLEMGHNGVRWIAKTTLSDLRVISASNKYAILKSTRALCTLVFQKYNRINHTISPFYAPTPGQRSEDAWDVAMRFPVSVTQAPSTQK